MPKPFRQLKLDQFADELARFRFTRKVTRVHMHHTQEPTSRDYAKDASGSIEQMWRYHTQKKGWSDIAQHLTIAPDGTVWTGRDWNRTPASATGFNDGVFMFETLGDFDRGHERLEGEQRRAVIDVIARVQIRCGLPVDSLHFHREYTDEKTCPGTGISKAGILAEVRARRAELEGTRAFAADAGRGGPFPESRMSSAVPDGTWPRGGPGARPFAADALEPAPEDDGEPDCGPRADAACADSGYDGSGRDARDRGDPGDGAEDEAARGVSFTPGELAELRAHVVNLNQGRFSNRGIMRTTPADVDAIFREHLPRALEAAQREGRPLRILFWAHGGLVSEARGIDYARLTHGWWLRNHVYPIYFIWETGIWETLLNLLRGRPRALEAVRGLNVDRVLEEVAHRAGGPTVWGGMKNSAAASVDERGGAAYVAERLAEFCRGEHHVELHAAGHSAGSIFHGVFIPRALDAGAPAFRTLHYLAPAVRMDEFVRRIPPLLASGGGVDRLTVYTMLREFEEDDNCGGIYRKSLLYLIHYALEAERGTPILGLEDSLRADPEVAALLGLGGHGGPHEVIWSPTKAGHGRSASRSTSHGGFDNDAATMESILRRVAELGDGDAIIPFPAAAQRDFTFEDAGGLGMGGGDLGDLGDVGDVGDVGGDGPGVGAPAPKKKPAPPQSAYDPPSSRPKPAKPQTGDGRGTKRALCVGINAYPAPNTLHGCVADARAWQEELARLGFEVEMLEDGDATEAAMRAAIGRLVRGAGPGDVRVLMYAGHGTQFRDQGGGAGDGETDRKDEAIVPVDFGDGACILDDELFGMIGGMNPGASLTCFFDCCHSQTALRATLVRALEMAAAGDGDIRPRYIDPTPEMLAEYARRRRASRGSRGPGLRDLHRANALNAVLFSACRDNEVAMEESGHGVFTRRTVPLLSAAVRGGLTNLQFRAKIEAAFGDSPGQHPGLDSPEAARGWTLLGSRGGRAAGE
ncbi:caspase family protein [Longimicrobium sp.]|uniref:caspase family protein n=1 Tax=Longimicrobium sp. TaxID=2029185 RepID=UPI002C8BAA97|nr:caspase family protein [Longimicrobium sp.]HSU15908.1 caspase family protein [Longimicrobium sp.]